MRKEYIYGRVKDVVSNKRPLVLGLLVGVLVGYILFSGNLAGHLQTNNVDRVVVMDDNKQDTRFDSLESELNDLKDELKALKESEVTNEFEDDNKLLKDELKALKDELKTLKESVVNNELDDDNKLLKDELKALKDELKILKESNVSTELDDDNKLLNDEIKALKDELTTLKESEVSNELDSANKDRLEKYYESLTEESKQTDKDSKMSMGAVISWSMIAGYCIFLFNYLRYSDR